MDRLILPSHVLAGDWLINTQLVGFAQSIVSGKLFERPPEEVKLDATDAERNGFDPEDLLVSAPVPGVAVLHISGVIVKGIGPLGRYFGLYDLDILSAQIRAVRDNNAIHTCIFWWDTPGGTSIGLYETAMQIRELTELKTTISYTDTACQSAGEYLASQCQQNLTSYSAHRGSIGAMLAIVDMTGALAKDGIVLEIFEGGRYKGIGNRPLNEADRAMLQARVLENYEEFKGMIRHFRADVDDEAMQGQTIYGYNAVERGVCDGIVSGYEELIAPFR